MPGTNPYGANQNTSDPREQVAWDFYVESISIGQANAYAAAIKAGYEDRTAKSITVRTWFKERLDKLRRKEMLSDAEKILQKTIRYKVEDEQGNPRIDLLKVQTDVAKHITSTLGKNEGYSTRSELTGKDGVAVQITGMKIVLEPKETNE